MDPDDFRKQGLGRLVKATEPKPSEQPADNSKAEAAVPDYYLVESEAEFDFTGFTEPNALLAPSAGSNVTSSESRS
jgi:hypothetical protein